MNTLAKIGSILAAIFFVVVAVEAQQATERYIPIGSSPGISDEYAVIGTIVAVSYDDWTITMSSVSGSYTVKVTPATRVFLDRSGSRKTNLPGRFQDCRKGQRAEVMHIRDDKDVALWIKLETVN